MRREIADRRLTEGSSFADSSELTSKTAALFSLMAEAVLDLAPPDTRRILSAGDSPFYEDTVLRRGIEVAFERLRRGQEPFDPDSALLRSGTVRPPSPHFRSRGFPILHHQRGRATHSGTAVSERGR